MRTGKSSIPQTKAMILLVDDNKMGLAARRVVLEELGHEVVTAANGLDALAIAINQNFDLLITDWKMPKLDGIELIRRLREGQFAAPIILLSGFADSAGMREDKTGADAVVQKSANEVQVLLSTVKRLLNRKPARKMPSPQQKANAVKVRPKAV
jgi:two-component system KDP operon response regulator KdpE